MGKLSRREIWAEMARRKVQFYNQEAWETKIKPLIDQHTLEELTNLAGW